MRDFSRPGFCIFPLRFWHENRIEESARLRVIEYQSQIAHSAGKSQLLSSRILIQCNNYRLSCQLFTSFPDNSRPPSRVHNFWQISGDFLRSPGFLSQRGAHTTPPPLSLCSAERWTRWLNTFGSDCWRRLHPVGWDNAVLLWHVRRLHHTR